MTYDHRAYGQILIANPKAPGLLRAFFGTPQLWLGERDTKTVNFVRMTCLKVKFVRMTCGLFEVQTLGQGSGPRSCAGLDVVQSRRCHCGGSISYCQFRRRLGYSVVLDRDAAKLVGLDAVGPEKPARSLDCINDAIGCESQSGDAAVASSRHLGVTDSGSLDSS